MSELPTRALSLKQPWAWAVVHGPKDVENRSWWSSIRGPIWIAASAQVTTPYYLDACERIKKISGIDCPSIDDVPYGAIVGRATIVDCILPGGYTLDLERCGPTSSHSFLHRCRVNKEAPGPRHPLHPHLWHFQDEFGYVLEDRMAIAKPVPCRGHQRWWTVPAEVLEQLRSTS